MADRSAAGSLADFSIRVPTRHPAAMGAYDADRHCYRPDYVHPKGWEMRLTARLPGLAEPPSRPLGKELPGDDQTSPTLPDNIRSYTWTVSDGGSFSTTITKDRHTLMPWYASITVPRTGVYEVQLSVHTTSGPPLENHRVFRIRDSLMVSIGESFASGQGNPDLRAVASDSQAVTCKHPKLGRIRQEIAAVYQEFKDDLVDKGRWLGKLAALHLQGVEELNEAIEDLANGVVDFFADFGRAMFGGSSGPSPRPARWQEPHAYRSYQSGPARAAYLLESESETHADRVTFLSFARTGAEVDAGLLGPRTVDNEPIDRWIGNIGEIEELKNTVGDRPIDVLHISIGGNDVGFAATLTDVVLGDFATGAFFTPWALVFQAGNDVDARRKVVDAACRRLVTLRNRGFPALAEAVAELQPRQVYINEYPVALFERMDPAGHPIDGGGCEIFSGADLDLSVDDWRAIKAIGVELNAAIHEAAAIHRWILIDGIVESFSGHGYCATADPRRPGAATNVRGSYFRTATQSCLNQGDFEGTMHPNEHGHQVYAERIAATVTANVARRDRWLVPALQAMMSPPTVVLWI